MKSNAILALAVATATALLSTGAASAEDAELQEVKATMRAMQQTIESLQKKVEQLEREKAESRPAGSSMSGRLAQPAIDATDAADTGITSPSSDKQLPPVSLSSPALDPKFKGFVPVPNTPVIFKINAKPRVDVTVDNQNSGDDDRFVTARIPVKGSPEYGGGMRSNINSKGSQLSLDARAPSVDGSPRFYFQNDFFGSGSNEYNFRVRQLYAQYYNFTLGHTYSVFEDSDAWPDTVDYEGPNAVIFARRPVVQYKWELNPELNITFGIEQPGSEVDTSIDSDASSVNHLPDGGLKIRWERENVGHIHLAGVARSIGVKGPITGNQDTFGWGVNLSSVWTVFGRDSIQTQLTYGEGIFRYINDDFINNDAAFDESGDLKALPVFAAVAGYTHSWSDAWRSALSYGFVNIENEASQGPDAYHRTHYASANVLWKFSDRLSVGLEGLYGRREVQNGDTGDVFRFQLGFVYSIFD